MRARGFTLIELVAVLVMLGIVASIGSRFLVSSVESYRDAQVRNRLNIKGRVAIEQITRYLRGAVPHSVRVSASGNCVESLPAVAGAFYVGQVSDSTNGAAATSELTTSVFSLDSGTALHAIIGPASAAEIYTGASPAARVGIDSIAGSPTPGIQFTLPHTFVRNSLNQRVFVADDPLRICLRGNNLVLHEGYGLDTGALNDVAPGGVSSVMATGVSTASQAFVLSAGSEDRAASLAVSLRFQEGEDIASMNQTVFIRNVP